MGKQTTRKIPLTRGLFALVDADDFVSVSRRKYYALPVGKLCYAARGENGTTTYLHADILGKRKGYEIDHINGNGLDCRKENLRHVTHQENLNNRNPHAPLIFSEEKKKRPEPKYPPRVTVEVESVKFREAAESAVRRIGFMNLSDYLRAQLTEAIAKAERLSNPKAA